MKTKMATYEGLNKWIQIPPYGDLLCSNVPLLLYQDKNDVYLAFEHVYPLGKGLWRVGT